MDASRPSASATRTMALLLLCVLVAPARCSGGLDGATHSSRLPGTTSPLSYELQFRPRLDNVGGAAGPTFGGRAKITVVASAATDVVALHASDLRVDNVTVTHVSAARPRRLMVAATAFQPHTEQFRISLGERLQPNHTYEVTVVYEVSVRTDGTGLFLSSYKKDGATKWMATTNLQPNYARRAFPCYDEPAYKTEFLISVIKEDHLTALSNMPIALIDQGPNDETEVVYFMKTPPMSTYLVALYVGDFVPNKNDSFITIFTSEDYINQTGYVEVEAPKHLRVMEVYTGINYTLPKMDLLAIPDMMFDGMENWGMNIYKEHIILLHEESTTLMKISSSMVIQHEFTHQWFGNLVTCSLWDYTWMNEGFATYFQYMATGMVNTDWQMEEMFVVEVHQNALAEDQVHYHPITVSVSTTAEIVHKFDSITYNKAAAVLRMLKYLITENLFQSSLRVYLNVTSEKSTVPSELYASFDNVLLDFNYEFGNRLSVDKFMSNWTLQSGYPMISITKNETTNSFVVTQSPFSIYIENTQNYTNSAWHIGLTYTTASSKNFSVAKPSYWTDRFLKTTVIPAPQNSGWYVFNIQSTGFYRVNYDIDNWKELIKQLKDDPTVIHAINRAQLIDDAFNLAIAGHLDYAIPLGLSEYLEKENSVTPWYSAKNCFSFLIDRMRRSEQGYENVKTFVSKLTKTMYKKLENLVSKGSNDFNILKAWDLFGTWACALDDKSCTNNVLEYFKKWQAGERISADIKNAAFCVGVKYSTSSDIFDRMFDLYKTSKSISERWSAALAMTCSTNKTQLTEYINRILDGPQGSIKSYDFDYIIPEISNTPLGFDVLYEFLSFNLNRTLTVLPDGEIIAEIIYSALVDKAMTNTEIEKVRSIKDDASVPATLRSSFNDSFKMIDSHLSWFNRFSDKINNYLVLKNKV